MPGMPIGDISEKAFLITNDDVDNLLENEKSFIFGRNPNKSPVPVYAVVTLCNPTDNLFTNENALQDKNITEPAPQKYHKTYIPLEVEPIEIFTDSVKRSSRLYPVFKRKARSAGYANYPKGNNIFENVRMDMKISENQLLETYITQNNNFIANLSHNVKFSGLYGKIEDNYIDEDHSSMPLNNCNEEKLPAFYVSYWMFYPYSQGKSLCTLNLGPFGSIPFPAFYGYCLGHRKDIGSHIGDWEHMSLYFNGKAEPFAMYVSAHDAGAFYNYNHLTGSFEFKKQETRKGILQKPNFPKTVTTFNNHPVLFAAKGSHGLWTAPGKHRFVKVARLYDINGFGIPWNTWKEIDITYNNLHSYGRSIIPTWLSFKGKWGNPKSKCHPLRRIGLNFCELTDGPTGIPLKEPHFKCGETNI